MEIKMGLSINWMREAASGDDINGTKVGDDSLWFYQSGYNGSTANHSYTRELAYAVGAKLHSECFECGSSLTQETIGNQSDINSIEISGAVSNNGDELYQVPLLIIILLSVLYGGISLAALCGNSLVLWIVTVSRRMRTVTNLFIANLAVADIIIGLFTIPFQFQAALLQRWDLPKFMCAFCPFVQVLSVNVSVFTLSAIAVDRYRAVLFPLSARVSKRKAGWAILSIWAFGFALALPQELDYKVIYIDDHKTGTLKPFCANVGLSNKFRVYYNIGLVVIQYFFPLIIITGAYAHMATKLWGTTAPGNREESRDAVVLRNKKKVITMCSIVALLFAVFYMPFQLYNLLQMIFPSINEYQYINIIWFCSHWLAMSNSCCNPFIYAIYNDKFQREFHARLRWVRRLCNKNRAADRADFIDKSKIRATYRFTNTRPLSRSSIYNNPSSVYGGHSVTRTTVLDSPREYSNANRSHLSPSPVLFASYSINNCRSSATGRSRHSYEGSGGSLSSGSSTNDVHIGVINSLEYDSYFHHAHGGIAGESSASTVVVNYEKNGIVSSSTVPTSRHDSVKRGAAKISQIEVDVCNCECD